MIDSKPKEVSFKEFFLTFYKLTPEYMFIIGQLLTYMEHVNDPNFGKENFKDSLDLLKYNKGLTIAEISKIVGRKYNISEEDSINGISAIKSAIQRTSRKSDYYKDIIDVLDTDEFELTLLSEYYNNEEKFGDLKWLYDSISDRDKNIVHYLMNDMLYMIEKSNENDIVNKEFD